MSVPLSKIHILSGIPLNNSYENTLYFETATDQEVYFLNKVAKTFDKFTYLRPEKIIKVSGYIENARSWNYLMFQNDANKWYYHFINKVEYINDTTVALHIEMDVMQTFMFDWELKPCFIERTHTPTDEIGEHTIPEGLETGPLIRYSTADIDLGENCILLLMSCNQAGGQAWGQMYGGVYSGLACYAVLKSDVSRFNDWLQDASSGGYVDAIVSMWMYPKNLVNVSDSWSTENVLHRVSGVNDTIQVELANPITNSLDGRIVQNKKLFCYPYSMLYVSNNMGGSAVYHKERFVDKDLYCFSVLGALSPESGLQLVPRLYKQTNGNTRNYEESLTHPAPPSCAWNSDTYKVWLAQNQNTQNLAIQQATIQAGVGLLATAASVPTGNMTGALAGLATEFNALMQIQGLMAQKADMAIQPDQARGNHSGNINMTHGNWGFSAYFMTITKEYVACIDDYFSRYGYKVNRIDTPSLKNRKTFTYIKTVGSLVTGNLGTEDQLKIQNIFNKGITFWVNPNNVGKYTIPNPTL